MCDVTLLPHPLPLKMMPQTVTSLVPPPRGVMSFLNGPLQERRRKFQRMNLQNRRYISTTPLLDDQNCKGMGGGGGICRKTN